MKLQSILCVLSVAHLHFAVSHFLKTWRAKSVRLLPFSEIGCSRVLVSLSVFQRLSLMKLPGYKEKTSLKLLGRLTTYYHLLLKVPPKSQHFTAQKKKNSAYETFVKSYKQTNKRLPTN